jgi:addiction module RelE/StbE family toxin
MTFNLGRQARADLADLRSYIATENSERVADNVVERIVDDPFKLCDYPRMGRLRTDFEEWERVQIRSMISSSWVIFYIERDQDIFVVRILHHAHDLTEFDLSEP